MERKFISRLFINQAKESGKTYLKGVITVKKEDIKGFINSDGDLVVPVFGHTFVGQNKSGQEYKAFNLEVINDEEDSKTFKKTSEKTSVKSSKSNTLDNIPF